MRLEFHKKIHSDISRIMDYYEDVAGPQLADEFYAELKLYFQKAADSPESYIIREPRSATSEPQQVSLPFLVSNHRRPGAHFNHSSP